MKPYCIETKNKKSVGKADQRSHLKKIFAALSEVEKYTPKIRLRKKRSKAAGVIAIERAGKKAARHSAKMDLKKYGLF